MLAIIPARGGSKGLKNKNILKFGNKPLIAHTILSALNSKKITRVIVTTDSSEIARIAKRYGAEVPYLRPKEISLDNSYVIDAYFDLINYLKEKENVSFKNFIALLPTCPLRKSSHIDESIRLFNRKNANSVISITETSYPPEWLKKINKKGVLINYFSHKDKISNRQNLSITYVPNGAIYIFNLKFLKKYRKYYSSKTYPYIMEKKFSVDIDDYADFNLAKFFLND